MAHHNNRLASLKRKCAFTLAEVLITLGIIGVVAAMTIPTLLNKYQMKVFETAFKKQYSVFQNAINYTVLENGISECYIYYPEGDWAYSFVKTDCNQLKNSLISLLHLQLYDREHDKEYQLTSKNDVIANGGKTVNGNCAYDNIAATYDSYFTKDGAFILFSRTDGVNNGPFIILDVNGRKGPNKWGYDVFFMTLSKRDRSGSLEQKIYLTDEYCSLAEKGGRLPRTILQNKDVTEAGDFGWFWK